MLDATFSYVAKADSPGEEERRKCVEHVQRTSRVFATVAESDGKKDRAGLLGLLELEKRARQHGISQGKPDCRLNSLGNAIRVSDEDIDPTELLQLMKQYFERFGDKACCFEDLKPYSLLEDDEHKQWTEYLDGHEHSQVSPGPLFRRFMTA